jgi:hypothetical protein
MTSNLSSRIVAAIVAFAGLSLLAIGVVAAQSDGVDVTVTASTLSITITDGSVAFGGQELGSTVDTVNTVPSQGQTVTNGGAITIGTLVAKYDNATEAECGAADWDASAGSPGTDSFVLRVDDDGQFGTGDTTLPISPTASANILGSAIPGSGFREIDFQLLMPTAVFAQNSPCTIALTFTASS